MHLIKNIDEYKKLIAKISFLTTDFGSALTGRKIIFKYFIDKEEIGEKTKELVTTNLSQSEYLTCDHVEDRGDVYTQAYEYMLTLEELSDFELLN